MKNQDLILIYTQIFDVLLITALIEKYQEFKFKHGHIQNLMILVTQKS